MNVFQGDPALIIDENGANLKFIEGQPVMDRGLENAVLLSIGTDDWVGNALFDTESQKLKSDIKKEFSKPITLKGLNKRKLAIERALDWLIQNGTASEINVIVTNPKSSITIVKITIVPPNGENVDLTLENFGNSWKFQAMEPAHRRYSE